MGRPFAFSVLAPGRIVTPSGAISCSRCGQQTGLEIAWNGPADEAVTIGCPKGHLGVTTWITGADAAEIFAANS